jgi:protein-tyrosine phosphatase
LLFLKKSKPLLKDVIPIDYVDIHSHLLPGIDDGAKTILDSIHLITRLSDIGITQFITTPHIINSVWNNTKESIEMTYDSTIETLNNEGVKVILNTAAEYMMDSFFFDLLKKEKPLLTLKDNYVLVEMSYLNPPLQLYDLIFEIQIAGYKPILAHPERYLFYYNNFNEFQKLKKAGCLFQLNLLSTVGYYGNVVTSITEKLLQKEMYDFVGSDVHHENHVNAFSNKILLKNHSDLSLPLSQNSFFKV